MTISGALAAIALLSNSVPILIGSMILAPAMPPLFLVPLGLVAGQRALVGRGLGVAAVGMALGFLAAVLTTWLMDLTGVIPAETYLLDKPLLEERLRPRMVVGRCRRGGRPGRRHGPGQQQHRRLDRDRRALALVPAAGAAGIALFSPHRARAVGGILLLAINVGLIIAIGLLALLAAAGRKGVRPLLLLPLAIILAVSLLLLWAQSTRGIPGTPASATTSVLAHPVAVS